MSEEKPYGIVYVLTSPSGKKYVGQTRQPLRKRLAVHKSTAKRLPTILLARAINKYGLDSFEAKQVDVAGSAAELDDREEHWIGNFNTMSPNGYNTREVKRLQFTDDVRKKISEAKMGHEAAVACARKQDLTTVRSITLLRGGNMSKHLVHSLNWSVPRRRNRESGSQVVGYGHGGW